MQAARRLGAISLASAREHKGVNRSERNPSATNGSARKRAVASGSQSERSEASAYLTLSDAARLAPGRPTSSATWRWCRKGLKARDGSTVHLKHVRIGRQVYTTAPWLHAFFEAVAAADQKHFEGRNALAAHDVWDGAAGQPQPPVPSKVAPNAAVPDRHHDLDAALREEGL